MTELMKHISLTAHTLYRRSKTLVNVRSSFGSFDHAADQMVFNF